MREGDRILLGGATPATIKTVRTPAEMSARLPLLREIFDDAAESGAELVAIVTIDDQPQPEDSITVIIQTPAGWETAAGEAITVDTLPPPN